LANINLSEQILRGLEEWAGEAHSSRFMTFYLKLLEIQAEVEASLAIPEIKLSRPELEARLGSGMPLFKIEEYELDVALVNATFHRVAQLCASYPDVLGLVPEALLSSEFDLSAGTLSEWLAAGELPAEIGGETVNTVLLGSLVQQTLRPFLIGYSQALTGRFSQASWRRNYCPVCGSDADFSYLEKEVGGRFLVCPTCCAEWQFQRTQCPYCGNTETNTMSYLTDEAGLYRLYLCERCKCYLKAIDLRKTTEKKILPLESLTTISLDRQGQEAGYHRGERRWQSAGP
jgi:FdhE protein